MMDKNNEGQSDSGMSFQGSFPRLYNELASWFHLLTAPEDYAEEAEFYRKTIISACRRPPQTLLELGSGGGNNASHLKAHFTMTLVDLSSEMLNMSKSINPECEHIQGDMRNTRLVRQFDAVFIHDAISHIATEADLKSTIETAFIHCKPGGAALFCPDYVRENYRSSTKHGGHDAGERGMRYLAWDRDPDPADNTYITDFAYILREGDNIRCEYDRMVMGLFGHQDWLRLIGEAGFEARSVPFKIRDMKTGSEVFLGFRPD